MKAFEAAAGTPWAIRQDVLQQILEIALRENELDPQALAAKLGRPLDNTHAVTHRDGVAVIPIEGPLFPKANLFTEISGATSMEVVAQDLRTALGDPSINAILLDIDSPGGTVAGTAELAGMIREADATKPVVAFVSDTAASGGYWLASAAREIVAAPTGILGSVGVVVAVRDPTKASSKNIDIVSSQSPGKRPDPTTERGKAQVQALADSLAEVFVADVARYRGTTVERVLSDFGGGWVKVGQEAVASGMADRLGTFEGVLSELSSGDIFTRAKMRPGPSQRAAASAQRNREAPMSEQERTDAATVPPVAAHAATEPPEAENLEVVALRAEVESLKRSRRDDRAAAIRREAIAFADSTIRSGKAMPFEAESIAALYTQAASDDALQSDRGEKPKVVYATAERDKEGKPVMREGSRADAVRASYNTRPSHGMFDNRVTTDPLPDGLSLHGNGSQGVDADEKLGEAATAWAEKRNGKAAAKS